MFISGTIRQRIEQSNTRAWLQDNYSCAHNRQMNKVTVYGQRLAELMQEKDGGMSQYALAVASGVPQPTIQRLLSGETQNPKMDTLGKLADVVGRELLTGKSSPPAAVWVADHSLRNTSEAPPPRGMVPVISWVRAGLADEVIDIYQPGDADEWIQSPVPVRAHTYALRIEGDSMEPDFSAGDIVIVEPDMPAEIGHFVIAKNTEGEATFKKLVKDAGRMYLKPLNPAYPMLPAEQFQIIGVVRGMQRMLC